VRSTYKADDVAWRFSQLGSRDPLSEMNSRRSAETPRRFQERDASPPPRSAAAKAATKKAVASKASRAPEQPMDTSNDACELCQRGGDLICCEECPAVFHCECLGKTMEELPDHYVCPQCDGSLCDRSFHTAAAGEAEEAEEGSGSNPARMRADAAPQVFTREHLSSPGKVPTRESLRAHA